MRPFASMVWIAAPAPFSSTFSQCIANTLHVAPNSAPVPITAQNPTSRLDLETPMLMFNVGPSDGAHPTNVSIVGNRSWGADTAFPQKRPANANGSFNRTPLFTPAGGSRVLTPADGAPPPAMRGHGGG